MSDMIPAGVFDEVPEDIELDIQGAVQALNEAVNNMGDGQGTITFRGEPRAVLIDTEDDTVTDVNPEGDSFENIDVFVPTEQFIQENEVMPEDFGDIETAGEEELPPGQLPFDTL